MSEIIFILFTFWVVRCNFSCVLCCSHSYETCGIFFLVGEMLQQQPHHLYAAPFFKQKYLFSREEVCNMLQRNFALIDIHTIRREIWVKPHDHTTTTSLQQEVTFCTNMPSAFQLTFASKSRGNSNLFACNPVHSSYVITIPSTEIRIFLHSIHYCGVAIKIILSMFLTFYI